MTPEISEATKEASRRVREIILSETHPGQTVILAGIGNTIGIE
jgi:hypothetical protein